MRRRVLSAVFVIAAIALAMPASAAYSGQLNDKITWTLTDAGVLVLTGTGNMPDYSASNPAPYAQYKNSIKNVIVGNGITSLGNMAFSEFSGLGSATLPSTITRVGDKAFYHCTNVWNLELPQAVTSIGESAFERTPISNVTLPACLQSVGCNAFAQTHISEITIPEGMKQMGSMAFGFIDELKTVNYNAIDCKLYRNSEYTVDGARSCFYMSQFTTLNIGPKVVKIPDNLAHEAYSMWQVNFADGCQLKEIGEDAFRKSVSLFTFDAPASLTKIGLHAFDESGLFAMKGPREAVYIGTTLYKMIGDKGEPFVFEIPEGTKVIQSEAFKGVNVRETVFPYSLTTIEDNAFENSQILSTYIVETTTNLGKNLYKDCPRLCAAIIKAPLKKLPDGMFHNCNISYTEFPETIEEIGNYTFYNAYLVEKLPNLPRLKVIGDYAFAQSSILTDATLPQGVTAIGNGAFSQCTKLRTYNLPAGLKSIGSEAYCNTAITSVELPEGLKTVGERCFNQCSKLTKMKLPRSVKYLPEDFVTDCPALHEIYVPHTVPIDFHEAAWTRSGLYNTYEKACLYVPRNSAVTYALHDKWGQFRNIREWDAAVTLPGDVNGDGVVDVTDANILINVTLGTDSASKYAGADVTGDGVVDIADVNAVLNIILGK